MTGFRASLPFALAAISSAAPPGYTEPSACRPCHQAIFDRYAATPMGRSFYLPDPKRDVAAWNNATFHHKASNQHFEMFRRDGKPFVRRFRIENGRRADLLEREVTHVMGSGERAVSLLHQTPEGRIYELPVAWYSQEKAWAMAPGYDRPHHAGFSRQVNHKCMFCHNAYVDVPPQTARTGWDADVLFPRNLPLGIDCQRCHGPGARHAATKSPSDIIHPGKLSPQRSLEVCMQCHYETTTFRLPESYRRFGRPFYSYRPGEPLGDYIVHFDHAPGTGHEEKFEIVSAAYRLFQSRCFSESAGRMTCLTCHSPHGERPRTADRCAGCHPSVSRHAAGTSGDCVSCHMPRRRTEDVVHVVMTDHKISRRPPPGDLVAPRREKTEAEQTYRGEVVQVYPPPRPEDRIYTGIAQVKEGANLEAGIRILEATLNRTPLSVPEPYFELGDALRVAGRVTDAVHAYRKALAADPAFPQAWNNLANVLADAGKTADAVDAYRQAIRLTPWDSEYHVNLGLTFLGAGRIAEARAAMVAAVRANPWSADAHANLGAVLLSIGEYAAARAELEEALAIEPGHVRARANLALAKREK